jgi:hypothetical protein
MIGVNVQTSVRMSIPLGNKQKVTELAFRERAVVPTAFRKGLCAAISGSGSWRKGGRECSACFAIEDDDSFV